MSQPIFDTIAQQQGTRPLQRLDEMTPAERAAHDALTRLADAAGVSVEQYRRARDAQRRSDASSSDDRRQTGFMAPWTRAV